MAETLKERTGWAKALADLEAEAERENPELFAATDVANAGGVALDERPHRHHPLATLCCSSLGQRPAHPTEKAEAAASIVRLGITEAHCW